jgi:septal ring factor EnvC (AmiA/AmiB activator)
MEGHSSRLEQAGDRISEVEDEMVVKRKTEEILVKHLKTCERKMQELTHSIKKKPLKIIGIEEGGRCKQKDLQYIQQNNTENYLNLEKVMRIQLQKASRTPKRLD